MALENITVNGKPLKQFVEKEKSNEIQEFLRFEIRAMRRPGLRHPVMVVTPARRPVEEVKRKGGVVK